MAENWTKNQLKALNDKGCLLVSASAGSGKTTIMIERILQYLENGGKIRRIVVITFSRASAREMKEKLLKEMYTKIRQGAAGAQWLKEQVKDAAFANICTIDSFCGDIFRRYFEDVGADPSAAIMDDGEKAVLIAEVINQIFEEYLATGDSGFIALAEQYSENRKLEKLKEIIIEIYDYINALAEPIEFLTRARANINQSVKDAESTKYLLNYYKKKISKIGALCDITAGKISQLAEGGLPLAANYLDILSLCISECSAFGRTEDIVQFLAEVERLPNIKTPLDRKQFLDIRDDVRAEAKSVIKSAKLLFEGLKKLFYLGQDSYQVFCLREQSAARNNEMLIDVTLKAIERCTAAKAQAKKLDFSDIEHYALKILANQARAAEVKEEIDYIFMDEYQDTNYLQEAIVASIAKDNLFMVGDVKQSIYKFRFAEPKLFLNRRKSYSNLKNGTNIDLNDNFRSESGVLQFINLVFDQVMTNDFGKVDYKNDSRLVAGKKYDIDGTIPCATVRFFEKESTVTQFPLEYELPLAPKLDVKDSQEAAYIANKIDELVGKKKIFDKALGAFRLIKCADIAVLVRSKNSAKEIFKALENFSIPYVAVGFEGDSRLDDINLLINLIRVIDNSRQDIPLVAIARSYFGGFSENELMQIRRCSNAKFYHEAFFGYNSQDSLKLKIELFTNKITKYKIMAAAVAVDKLLDNILAGSGYDAYLISAGNRIELVNTFISQIRGKEWAKSVSQFLAYVESGQAIKLELAPANEDAVVFQTIHGSKGLEYPIVFYAKADSGWDERRSSKKLLFLDAEFGLTLKHRDEEEKSQNNTIAAIAYAQKAKIEELEEYARLMYVAMTRARYHLFITATDVNKKRTDAEDCRNTAEWICYAGTKDNSIEQYFDKADLVVDIVRHEEVPRLYKKGASLQLSRSYCHSNATKISTKYAVSAVAREQEDEAKMSYVPSLGDTNAELGTTYHAILENIDIQITAKPQIIAAVAELERIGVIRLEDKVIDYELLERVLNSELFDYARKWKIKRELPFMLYLPAAEILNTDCQDKVLVQGVVDLVIFGDKNILVDYKLSSLSAESAKKRYGAQLKLYATAVEKLMNIKLERRVIYIINQNLQIDL